MRQIPHPALGRRAVRLGRLAEWDLRDRPDADRIALHRRVVIDGGMAIDEYTAHVYRDRATMLIAYHKASGQSISPAISPVVPQVT